MSTDLTAKVPPPPPPQRVLWLQKTSLRNMLGGSATPFRAPDVRVDGSGGGAALTGPPHGSPDADAGGALPPPPPAVPVPQPTGGVGSPPGGGAAASSATAPPALALSASSKKRPGMLVSNGSALRIISAMRRAGGADGDGGNTPVKGAAQGPVPLLHRKPVQVGLAVALTALIVGCAVYYAAAPRTVTRTVEVVPDWANFGPDEVTLWSYAEKADNGPHMWGEIRNETSGALLYPTCADSGVSKQSPIAIDDPTGVTLVGGVTPLSRNYTARGLFQVVPRPGGHPGFQVAPYNDSAEARWVLDGVAYDLVQFHYHSPSEHTLNGVRYPLEVHFVHRAPSTGALAVFGILYPDAKETEDPNPYLRVFWDEILAFRSEPVPNPINLAGMINDIVGVADGRPAFYRYAGSLTTPPCSEGVSWAVAVSKAGVNTAQIIAYRYAVLEMESNYRPTQPLHGRVVSRFN